MKTHEPLGVPNLLDLQINFYNWLTGNEAWQADVEERPAAGRTDVSIRSGLEKIFSEISPIEDFNETTSLSPRDHRFEEPKHPIEECKDHDVTYATPLFVTVEFVNNETSETRSQTVFIGDSPLMTGKGTFIINGTERVVVSQLVRSPGVYFEITPDKGSDKDIYSCKVTPPRGAWLEFEIDKCDMVFVRPDRKRKQNVTVLLKTLGWSEDRTFEEFGDFESMRMTLEKDTVNAQDEALLDIYRKLRPSESPVHDAAQALLKNYYFNPKRYSLAKVGRYKINKKLELDLPFDSQVLTMEDVVVAIKYAVVLHEHKEELNGLPIEADDTDYLGNRRLRTVGELVQNQLRTGLGCTERVVRDRMTTQNIEAITPWTLINVRPVTVALKESFGTSQLSQFMNQNNLLAGLTHKRRFSALDPGGLSRDRTGMEVRDVYSSHYSHMYPTEILEGPNIGLIGSLASFTRVNVLGFVETLYRCIIDGRVTDQIDYLIADEEDRFSIAQANVVLGAEDRLVEEHVLVRIKYGDVDTISAADVEHMDVPPRQAVSVATTLISFLEHDDASWAPMGTNMQHQAVPLIRNKALLVGTGTEHRAAVDVGDATLAKKVGMVSSVTADIVEIVNGDATYSSYRSEKFVRFNAGICTNQYPLVAAGDRVEVGTPLADGSRTDKGELALGRNLLVAFMSWEGFNCEDAIILSQRPVQDDVLISIHIEEHEVDVRDTKLGAEKITRDIPNISDEMLADLDRRGIVRIGVEVSVGDTLVDRITPKGETELTPEERLLRTIFGKKVREIRDTSPKVPHGESGTVIGIRVFDTRDGDEPPSGVNQLVQVYVAQKRKISDGDKSAGRHGNKGVISKILPVEDMPFPADGTPVDIVLNPLGVPSRMNIGQVSEDHLGWIAETGWNITGTKEAWVDRLREVGLGRAGADSRAVTPAFDGIDEHETTGLLEDSLTTRDGERLIGGGGKAQLFDGRPGEPHPEKIGIGYMYMPKSHHLVDDKIRVRSTGPYSMITQQLLGGEVQFGGQRFGEMEVRALEAYRAAWALQELLTIKFDDVPGRVKIYEATVKGENIPESGILESFRVLAKEMQPLCLNVEVLSGDDRVIDLRDSEDDLRNAEDFGIDLGGRPGGDHFLDVTEA